MLLGLPYIPADERNTSTAVNRNGLSDAYAVTFVVDGKRYETGLHINENA